MQYEHLGPYLMVLQWNQSWIQQIGAKNPLSVTFIWEMGMSVFLKRCKYFVFNLDNFFYVHRLLKGDQSAASCHENFYLYSESTTCLYNVQNWSMYLKWWDYIF